MRLLNLIFRVIWRVVEDEKELIRLIRVVYNEISTLNFMDDEELMKSPDNSLGIKDIKAFIELMLAKNPNF